MLPILRVIANSIKRKIIALLVPTTDPYLDNVVLSLRMESTDPYYNQVVLLMHMEDAGLTDVKGHTINLVGNTARSATQAKFGTYSAYFDGTGDYLTSPDSADFNFGSGDFTVECWVRTESLAQTQVFFHRGNSTGYDAWMLLIGTNGKITTLGSITGTSYAWTVEGSKVLSVSTWYHIALVRSGTTIMTFVDGIMDSIVTGVSGSLYAPSVTLKIGCDSSGSVYEFTGYIDEVRLTKGVARYTKNFIVPSAAFPEPANTAIDDKGKTVTSNGNAQFSGVSKYGTGSFYFDGTGDYLSVPDSSDWSFGTADFTVEAWVRFDSSNPAVQTICGQFNTSSNWWFLRKEDNTTNKLSLYFCIGGTVKANYIMTSNWTTWSADTWYHIAMVRSGSTMYLFINGVSQTLTVTVAVGTNDMGDIASPLYVGSDTTYALKGYIDDLRITKGVARYTSNFTPYKILTTAPAGDPWYNYTSLLLKMNGTNGGTTFTDNSYSPKTITVNGNANTSTAEFKYGTASGYFDGTGDYLRTPYTSGFDPGATGDYTAECWIYPTNVTSIRAIFGSYCNPSATQGWLLFQSVSGELTIATRDLAGTLQGCTSTAGLLVINQWQHVAWTKTGKVHRLWHNGIKVAEATDTIDLYVNPSYGFIIGRWDDSGTTDRDFVGYMDDVRLTKGIARYTTTFQPPGPHIAAIDPDTDQWWLNTVLALRMDGAHGSNTFTDLIGKTVTANGNVSISSAVSKFGQAAYFDGTGDYLSVTGPSFGTNDFCVEAWVYPTVNNNILVVFDTRTSDNDSTGFAFYLRSTGKLAYIYGNGVVVEGTTTYSANTWHHVAVTRISGTVKLYLNGVQEASFAQANSYSNTAWKIGQPWSVSGNLTPGYIDDLRVTQSVGRYTAAFTPSQKPLPTYVVGPDHDPYWDKVVLALPFDNGLIEGRAKTVTAYGGAGTSIVQKKFGVSSCYFDGSGDYLSTTDYDDLDIGLISASTNWTLECWVYAIDPAGGGVIATHAVPGSGGTGRGGWCVGVYQGKVYFYLAHNVSGASNLFCFSDTTSAPIRSNYWSHVAVTLYNGIQYIFVDGIPMSLTVTLTNGYYQATPIGLNTTKLDWGIDIGRSPPDSSNSDRSYFTGYIDDLRITKGIARYTADFDPPTSANILG